MFSPRLAPRKAKNGGRSGQNGHFSRVGSQQKDEKRHFARGVHHFLAPRKANSGGRVGQNGRFSKAEPPRKGQNGGFARSFGKKRQAGSSQQPASAQGKRGLEAKAKASQARGQRPEARGQRQETRNSDWRPRAVLEGWMPCRLPASAHCSRPEAWRRTRALPDMNGPRSVQVGLDLVKEVLAPRPVARQN